MNDRHEIARRHHETLAFALIAAGQARAEANARQERLANIMSRHVDYVATLEGILRATRATGAPIFNISDLMGDDEGDEWDIAINALKCLPPAMSRLANETRIAVNRLARLQDAHYRAMSDGDVAGNDVRAIRSVLQVFEQWEVERSRSISMHGAPKTYNPDDWHDSGRTPFHGW